MIATKDHEDKLRDYIRRLMKRTGQIWHLERLYFAKTNLRATLHSDRLESPVHYVKLYYSENQKRWKKAE